jgi:RNA polymerase sigma factor (sigma-70 family)
VPCNDYGGLIEQWKVDLIKARARRFGFRDDELPDLEQVIVLQLIEVEYAPGDENPATERTFVRSIVDRLLARHRRDQKRDRRRASHDASSLDSGWPEADEALVELHRSYDLGLRLDVQDALAGLSPVERALCEALMQGQSRAEVARKRGVPRAAVSKQVSRLAEKFRLLGLEAYVARRRRG